MTFADLHELLRLELVRRIEAGHLTGTRLAQQTGFRQAHISNFLNRKRSLSLEGLDRVLEAQHLTVDQLLPLALEAEAAIPAGRNAVSRKEALRQQQRGGRQAQQQWSDRSDANASWEVIPPGARELSPRDELVHNVPLVSSSVAMNHPRIAPAAVLESLPVAATRLLERNPRAASLRQLWQRFVAIRVDAQQAAAMSPLLTAGAAAVLDRHATSPIFHARSAAPALFAVRSGTALLLRLVELDDDRLILRPLSSDTPVQLLPISQEDPPGDCLVGRVILLLTSL